MQGRWADTNGLLNLSGHLFSFFGRKMGLWRANYTPVDGWADAAIDPLTGVGATLDTGFWDSGTLVAPGLVKFTASGGYLTFGGPPFSGGVYYGWYLAQTADPTKIMYAERFDFAPAPIDASHVIVFRPVLYLANPLTTPPAPDMTPTGTILFHGAAAIPAGYLVCDGTAYATATYPALFAVIGVTFGTAGAGTFKVPDLRGQAPIGNGTGPGLTPRVLGVGVGAETHTLVTGEIPAHTHPTAGAGGNFYTDGPTPTITISISAGGNNFKKDAATGSAGSGGAHNNMPPSLPLVPIIKT